MTTILIKKKDTAGAPAAGDLTNAAGGAEIAVNTATKRLYTKDSGGTVVELGTNPSALTTNLLFSPDATYDIGASGASRPRDMFLSRNLTVGGTLTLTGGVNFNGNVTIGDSAADTLTVNSTITSNLIFTDNTYDIGANGATRPRTGYFGTSLITPLIDATNVEATNIKALDGTAAMSIANSTGVVSLTANPILSGGTANGVAYLNGSKVLTTGSALVFDGTNLGSAVTPSAWKSNYRALQVGNATAVVGRTDNNNNYFSSNWYVNSSDQDIYQNTGFATIYTQGTGTHAWYTAPSGTAGNAITLVQAMALDSSRNLIVGTGAENGLLTVRNPSANKATAGFLATDTSGPNFGVDILSYATAANTTSLIRGYSGTGSPSQVFNLSGFGNITQFGGQIFFPAAQSGSSDANCLDDYEEGTWTPVLGGSTSEIGQTYSRQLGQYTKVGRQVTVTWDVIVSNVGTMVGNGHLKGLPFTVNSTNQGYRAGLALGEFSGLATAVSILCGLVVENTTDLYIRVSTTGTATGVAGISATSLWGTGTQFIGTITYFV